MSAEMDICEDNDWEEFFRQTGNCKVLLQFYYVASALLGLGLLLLFVIVQGIIIMIFTCYACKHGRLKKSYNLNTNGTQEDNDTLELQLRRGLIVNSQEDITDSHGNKQSLRNVSEDLRYSNDRLHGSQPVLNQNETAPPLIQDGTYDAIGDIPNLATKSNTLINNPQYASVDQNQAAPPPPPPPPPSLPGSATIGNKREEPTTEVFNIGDIGAVTVGSYQYASVDKSNKEQAPPPPPPPPPDPASVETFDPNKWAPVQDAQYAVVDKTRSYDNPPTPTPTPPPPPPPPPPAPAIEDYSSISVKTRGATAQTTDPTVQLQAAIEALYDSVQ